LICRGFLQKALLEEGFKEIADFDGVDAAELAQGEWGLVKVGQLHLLSKLKNTRPKNWKRCCGGHIEAGGNIAR